MATKKTQAAAKTAAKEVKETAVKEAAPVKKEKAVKETVKKETAKEAKKAEPAKAAEKKPAKAAEKKAPAKKAAKAKAETKVYFEYFGKQVDMAKVVAAVEKKAGAKAKSVRLYVKAEDDAVYYVVDDKETGKIDL